MIVDVIIPAYNEEQAIGHVIKDIPKHLVREIVVVNNNSTDQTASAAVASGAAVVNAPLRGYGNACLQGLKYLRGKSVIPDIVVFIDGDYSDFPNELDRLLEPLINNEADFVIGSRKLGQKQAGSMVIQQRFGNWLATSLIWLIFGFRFTDLGPFRAVMFNKLLELNMQDETYGWTVEMQIKAVKKKLRIAEVPVDYKKRIGVSKISGTIKGSFLAGYKIITTILKYSFNSI